MSRTQPKMATPTPWTIRPCRFDDWGYIRGADGEIACIARGPSDKSFDQHRADKTDPYGPNAALIVDAVNSHAYLKARIAELEANEKAYEEIIGKKTYQEVADRIREMESHLGIMVKEFTDHHYPGCPKEESDSAECNCYAGAVTESARKALQPKEPT